MEDMAKSNVFGRALRATRLGYRFDPVLKAWVRVSRMAHKGLVDGAFLVEACPDEALDPFHHGGVLTYICWWEGMKSVTDHSQALREKAPVTEAVEWVTDDNGDIIALEDCDSPKRKGNAMMYVMKGNYLRYDGSSPSARTFALLHDRGSRAYLLKVVDASDLSFEPMWKSNSLRGYHEIAEVPEDRLPDMGGAVIRYLRRVPENMAPYFVESPSAGDSGEDS